MAVDIAQWLEGLGLGQYAQAFAGNDIDLRALPQLSEDDLKELGLSLGHRRILQGALKEQQGGPLATSVATGAPLPDESRAATPAEAERRQLTVMFCDLVGSTALSARLDPEDYRDVMRAYQETASAVVRRYDGHVAKFLGDGILVYFGYPRAHEDDAERAVRTGLDVVQAVERRELVKDLTVQTRIGIATGLVVAGDLAGEGVSEQAAVSGETPNLAARLQELAEPGSVVIGESTHRLVGQLFECTALGEQDLKGFARAGSILERRSPAARREPFRRRTHRATHPTCRSR